MNPIRVLIIDDSAFARKVIREVLSRDFAIEVVGIARDGLEGLEKIAALKPDVVTLDLIMPDLDGLGVLRALQKTWSPKVVIVSVSGSETELALEALEAGAVALVAKPTPLASDRLYELSAELVDAVKVAASAQPRQRKNSNPFAPQLPDRLSAAKLVVIGTSTGGPQALADLFKTLPAGLSVPIAIALHIPSGYTAPLAARVSGQSAIKMVEAENNMELLNGHAYIAPGGMHLKIRRADGCKLYAQVSHEPRETLHHPSVDVLFESAARATGSGTVAVVLTGMGNDGEKGAALIRRAGGRVLAESASSCVVYGMPRSVIEAGLADGQAPLEQMPGLIIETIYTSPLKREVSDLT